MSKHFLWFIVPFALENAQCWIIFYNFNVLSEVPEGFFILKLIKKFT